MIGLGEFSRMTAGLVGLDVWDATVGWGSFVTMNFGEPQGDDPPHGEFHLWLYCCSWRIERGAAVVACCEDDRESMQAGVTLLNGQRLLGLDVEAASLSATLTLTGDLVVRVFSICSEDGEHWKLRLPDGRWIMAGPGRRMVVES